MSELVVLVRFGALLGGHASCVCAFVCVCVCVGSVATTPTLLLPYPLLRVCMRVNMGPHPVHSRTRVYTWSTFVRNAIILYIHGLILRVRVSVSVSVYGCVHVPPAPEP